MVTDKTLAEQHSEDKHGHGLIGMILDVAVRFRWAMIVLTAGIAIWGALNLLRLPIDAVPDITNVQVQINTEAPALSPSQVETQVTYPGRASRGCHRMATRRKLRYRARRQAG